MDLEIIILSEVSQTEKDKYHMILLICISLFFLNDTNELVYKKRPRKQTDTENKLMVTKEEKGRGLN